MDTERRRALVDRIFADAAARNTPIDNHPSLLGWIEEWVRYEIDIDELRDRYAALKREQMREKREKIEGRLAAMGVDFPAMMAKAREPAPDPRIVGPTLAEVLNEMGWKPDEVE